MAQQGEGAPADLDMATALQLLPPDIRKLVEGLPPEEAQKLVEKLLQQSEIEFRPLSEDDVKTIKARTNESSQYGFLPVDVDFTWEEINQQSYLCIGAFSEREGQPMPVGFVVAEVNQLQNCKGRRQHVVSRTGADDAERLQRASGAGGADIVVGVYYIGVDFEYRRQGIGQQLLDYVAEVAGECGARCVWLNVAEYNERAVAFYTRYGFQRTEEFKVGERGNHRLMLLPLLAQSQQQALQRLAAAGPSSASPSSAGGFGGAGGGAKGGKGGGKGGKKKKARCLPEGGTEAALALGDICGSTRGSSNALSCHTASPLGRVSVCGQLGRGQLGPATRGGPTAVAAAEGRRADVLPSMQLSGPVGTRCGLRAQGLGGALVLRVPCPAAFAAASRSTARLLR